MSTKAEVARLIRALTLGSYNIEHLCGEYMRYARMLLMTKLTGTDTDYELSSLYAELYALFEVTGTCTGSKQLKLITALREAMIEPVVA